ncbi:MAG TPA: peptidoglycan DD-metalloendopeptidase family protein [Candidatus Paceibacterota bacterium]
MKIINSLKIENHKPARRSHSGELKIAVTLSALFLFGAVGVFAQNVTELENKIENHTEEIKKLDQEIKKWEGEINSKQREAKTLQNTIQILDTNAKKIGTEIKKTEVNISKVNLSISELSKEISIIEGKIEINFKATALSLSDLNRADDESLVEVFLGSESMAEVLDQYESAGQFQDSIRSKSVELSQYKDDLQGKKVEVEGEKKELVSLKTELGDQKMVLDINKKEKNTVLTETKNKESEYKKILAQKQIEKEKFEKELFDFESQLKIAIDPNNYASAKKGVLEWPLDSIFITQQFGKTADAKRLYTSGTHNGVDFRASRGTRVLASLSGVVQSTGNTDAQKSCYSYGKWVLIKHGNGLTTLYAHLDLIKVVAGQAVSTSDIIGYSGQTGYATGPHLHFTLYASEGVSVQRYSQSRNCKNVDIPVASSNAYLDPMRYFPSL